MQNGFNLSKKILNTPGRVLTCLIYLLIFYFTPALGKEEKIRLTLQEAVRIALLKNPSIQIKKMEKQIVKQDLGMSRFSFLPQADFVLKSFYIHSIDTFTPISIQIINPDSTISTVTAESIPPKYETNFSILARQNLFKGFQDYGNYQMSRARYQAAGYAEKEAEQDVIYNVAKSYWELQLSQDELESELFKYVVKNEDYSLSKIKLKWGQISQTAYEENEVQFYENENQLQKTKNNYKTARSKFFRLLGAPDMAQQNVILVSNPIEILKKIKWKNENDEGAPVLSNSEIKKLEKELDSSKYKKMVARSGLYPSFDISFQYDFVGRSDSGFDRSFDNLKEDQWIVMGIVQFKLLDSLKTAYEIKKANVEYQINKLHLEKAKNDLTEEFEIKKSELNRADAEINLAVKKLEIENKHMKESNTNYQKGDISKNELSHKSFLQMEANYEYRKKVINKLLRTLELNKMKGTPLLDGLL